MFIATLIADGRLNESIRSEVAHQFDTDFTAGRLTGLNWIDEGSAFDLVFEPSENFKPGNTAELAEGIRDVTVSIAKGEMGLDLVLDVIVQPAEGREKKLLAADMDSTIIGQECIDELADYAGIKPSIAEITDKAMRGELDFVAALAARVALLEGLDTAILRRCLDERIRPNPGAATLARTMRARGAGTLLLSGGFVDFVEPIAALVGFEHFVANQLARKDGELTGDTEGPIVDAEAKRAAVVTEREDRGLAASDVLAIGDGANDIPMIRDAGLGIAYRGKPAVIAAADARLDHHGLDALLWAQGIARKDWVEA